MKTCNNCGTRNDLAVHKCVSCRMPGNFTFEVMPGEAAQIPEIKIQCVNCGSNHPGEGRKCSVCNFPLNTSVLDKNNEKVQEKSEDSSLPNTENSQ